MVARPIVADVPVGAVDSTLGTVTQAYQMILPSISDAGTAAVVVSPFTTILSEAIVEGKEETEGFVEDLTLAEGCTAKGDAVASSISSKLAALESSIETNFDIEITNLYTDFIELNSTGLISEQSAINIAKVFPYLQEINDEISEYLTNKYNKTIRANAVLDKESLDIIFSGNAFEKLPLSFTSIYETEPNASGWFQREEITASGAELAIDGVLSREHCTSSSEELCNVSTVTLENIVTPQLHITDSQTFSTRMFLLKRLILEVLPFILGMLEIGEMMTTMTSQTGKITVPENVEERMMYNSKR